MKPCFLLFLLNKWCFCSSNTSFLSSKWNTWVSSLALMTHTAGSAPSLKSPRKVSISIFIESSFLFILCFLVFRECRVARRGGGQHSGEPVTDTLLYQQCTRSVTPSCTTIWCTRSIVSLKVGHSQRFTAAQYWMLLYDWTCTEFRELNGRSDIGDRCLLHPYKGSSLH